MNQIQATEYLAVEVITDHIFLSHPTGHTVVILRPGDVGAVCKALVEAAVLASQYRPMTQANDAGESEATGAIVRGEGLN